MYFCNFPQFLLSVAVEKVPTGFQNSRTRPQRQSTPPLISCPLDPLHKSLTGQNGSSRNCYIALTLRPLLQFNIHPLLLQGPLENPGISELITEGPGAIRHSL